MYSERPSWLADVVIWRRQGGGELRVLPDGCTDLIWSGEELRVAGPDTGSYHSSTARDAAITGVRFAPGLGPAVLATSAAELRNQRVPLDAIWPSADVRRLRERLAADDDPGAVLEQAVAERAAPRPALLAEVVALLGRGWTVGATADAVGLTVRQLHRRSLTAFGYGPKTLATILRFRRALHLARAGHPLAWTAAHCGYADQAHLARDVKRLAGVPLGQLVGRSTRSADAPTASMDDLFGAPAAAAG